VSITYSRIYADEAGESHIEDLDIAFAPADFAPPAPPLNLSSFVSVSRFGYLSAPAGWCGDWHPAPCRQYLVYLAGVVEVETSDGTVRRFGPGSVTLVEDTTGKGHRSRVVGDEDVVAVIVQLD
jgi:hypothetical protein